jgi:hypothetical protein
MKKLFLILLASSAAAAAPAQDSGSGSERKASSHDVHELEKRRAGGRDDDCDGATGRHSVSGTVKTESGAGASAPATAASGSAGATPPAGGVAQRHAIRTKGTGASGRAEDQQGGAAKYSAPVNITPGIASLRTAEAAAPPAAAGASGKARHEVAMSCIRNMK